MEASKYDPNIERVAKELEVMRAKRLNRQAAFDKATQLVAAIYSSGVRKLKPENLHEVVKIARQDVIETAKAFEESMG